MKIDWRSNNQIKRHDTQIFLEPKIKLRDIRLAVEMSQSKVKLLYNKMSLCCSDYVSTIENNIQKMRSILSAPKLSK